MTRKKLYIQIAIIALLSILVMYSIILNVTHDLESNKIFTLVTSVLFAFIIFTSITIVILEFNVFNRINTLKIQLTDIRRKKSTRIHDYEKDDMTDVSDKINSILECLESKQLEAKEKHELYISLVEDAPILVKRFLPDGTITFANNTYVDYFGKDITLLDYNIFKLMADFGENVDELKRDLYELNWDNQTTSHVRYNKKTQRYIMWINRALFDNHKRIIEYQSVGVDITEQKESVIIKEKLDRNYEFQSLISSSISDITSCYFEDLDVIIDNVFDNLAKFLNVDRVFLFLTHDGIHYSNTNEICGENILSCQMNNLRNIHKDTMSWWLEQLYQYKSIVINDVDSMPLDAENEKAILQAQDIKSNLTLPVSFNHTFLGFIGVDNVTEHRVWAKEEVELLGVLGKAIGSMFRGYVEKDGDKFSLKGYKRLEVNKDASQ